MNLEEFSRSDVQDRLKGVILANMFSNPFRNYNSLNRLEKLNFKKEMNAYINDKLSGETWEDVLIKDYNELICAYMDDQNHSTLQSMRVRQILSLSLFCLRSRRLFMDPSSATQIYADSRVF